MTNQEKQKQLGLNDKQTAFCLEYVANGFNATRAYLSVYKPKSESVGAVNANKLLRIAKTDQFVEFLKLPKALELEVTREKQFAKLKNAEKLALIEDGNGRVNLNAHLKAIELQNKMFGLDAPQRIEFSGELKTIIKVIGLKPDNNIND